MTDVSKLPLGMRLNNPGNMRDHAGPMARVEIIEGFAKFDSIHDGCESLFYQLWINYEVHGLKTLWSHISRWAPDSENNVVAYCNSVCLKTGWSPLKVKTTDMRLDQAWRAVDLARAQIAVEQGPTPGDWRDGLEWVSPSDLVNAMVSTGKWRSA